MGLRRSWWMSFFGLPRGLPGRLGVRLMPKASRRFNGAIAAGTAEIVKGDADRLPWEDGRFSVATSVNSLKFFPDPLAALREMHRVLRPGGRMAVTMGEAGEAPAGAIAGVVDKWGQWQWTDDAAKRLVGEAGFTDVTVSVMPVFSKALLARGAKPAPAAAGADRDAAVGSGRAGQDDRAGRAQP